MTFAPSFDPRRWPSPGLGTWRMGESPARKAAEVAAVRAAIEMGYRLIDTAEPAAPGPGDALVKVHRVGICGTDYGGFLGKMPFFSYPRIPGHELGVEVLAVGEGVTNVKPGDRCSVEPYLNCQKCYACRRGHTNCCEHNKTLGVMCDGGLAERFQRIANPGLRAEQETLHRVTLCSGVMLRPARR